MDVKKNMFLTALKAALKNEKVSWSEELESQDWVELFRIATTHQVLPLIYEAVYDCPAARNMEPQVFMSAKQQTIRSVMLQTMKTKYMVNNSSSRKRYASPKAGTELYLDLVFRQ